MNQTTEFEEMTQLDRQTFSIVHPLDDQPEEKMATAHLGPMRLTPMVRACLFVLRGYLFLMLGLLAVRVLQLAGMIHG